MKKLIYIFVSLTMICACAFPAFATNEYADKTNQTENRKNTEKLKAEDMNLENFKSGLINRDNTNSQDELNDVGLDFDDFQDEEEAIVNHEDRYYTLQEIKGMGGMNNPFYDLDEANKTILNIYENTPVSSFKGDFIGYYEVTVYRDGIEILDGYVEAGMTVKITYDGELYGEYTVNELKAPEAQMPSTRAANGYGFTTPLLGWRYPNNITSDFQTPSRPNHNGIDISWGGIGGTSIHAVKAGTATVLWDAGGYGNYVQVEHGSGLRTLYAHMHSVSISSGPVIQGEQLGTVGTTGSSTGDHLHFEVRMNGVAQNSGPYLTGAGDPEANPTKLGRTVSGDFNDDGIEDIACIYGTGGNGYMSIWVFKSTSYSFTGHVWYTSEAWGANYATGRVVAGDFNDDGIDDICALYGNENNVRHWVFKSTGNSFTSHVWYSSDYWGAIYA